MLNLCRAVWLSLAVLIAPAASLAADRTADSADQSPDDAAITLQVRASIEGDRMVGGRDIKVRTDRGVVDLTGSVVSEAEWDRATELAAAVKAVMGVHNILKISAN